MRRDGGRLMAELQSLTIKPAGSFSSYEQWCAKASGWIDAQAICWDTAGNVCRIGRDFMAARDAGRFPVAFGWPGIDPETDEGIEFFDRMVEAKIAKRFGHS